MNEKHKVRTMTLKQKGEIVSYLEEQKLHLQQEVDFLNDLINYFTFRCEASDEDQWNRQYNRRR